jgi:UDP-glucose 4-epimerase
MATKILITGIAGLLGSNYAKYLLQKGYNIIGIDDLSGGYYENIPKNIYTSFHNLIDGQKTEKFIKEEKPEYIYHFAAYAAEGLSPFIRSYNYFNNLISSINLINASIKYNINKIIFTSSMAVYGDKYKPPFREDMIPSPIDPYGIAKYAVEMDLKQAFSQFNLQYSIIRPHNVIGINQNIWDRYRNVIGIWIRNIINNEYITIFGDGLQKRAFSDINYYYEPFEKLMYNFNNEIFNIGSDNELTILETANLVKKCALNFGFKSDFKFFEERHEAKYAFCSHEKAKKMLNFVDNTDLEVTINNMIEWSLKQPKRKIKSIDYEINKNIYSFWK